MINISEKIISEIIRRYQAGESPAKLARIFHVARSSVYRWIDSRTERDVNSVTKLSPKAFYRMQVRLERLQRDNDVVVGVDREKLYTEEIDLEDSTNHAVVVTHINKDSVTVFDPYQEPYIYNIPIADFLNAWKESRNYMIQVLQSIEEYEPHPVKLSDVIIDEDLDELQEAIAENAHEVWAEARIKEGWTYGRERDDARKKHPDLIPYSALPDSEKVYDRLMAYNTIKLVKKLGFDIVKK